MESCKLRERDLAQTQVRMSETDLMTADGPLSEDFEQVEDSLWEEYLQEDGTDSGMTPERSFVKMRMEQAMAVLLTFVITNIFYVIILFLAWYIPAGFLYGCSIFEGAFVMTVVGGALSVAGYDENNGTVHNILTYFPVSAKRLRREMYTETGKYLAIQVLITCVPMLIMAIDFKPERFLITILCNIGAMLVMSTLLVEGSMHMMKARK